RGCGLLGRCLLRRALAGEHRVLERLQGRDARTARRLDADRLTGLRFAAHACRTVDARELGEAADHHDLATGDGVGDRVDERLQVGVGGALVGVGALGERGDEVSAVHGWLLLVCRGVSKGVQHATERAGTPASWPNSRTGRRRPGRNRGSARRPRGRATIFAGGRRRGGRQAMNRTARILVAELIGTMILILGGPGTVIFGQFLGFDIGVLGVSLAFGLSLLCAAYLFGHISGCHINPAVTVGMWALKRTPGKDVPAYLVRQILGAALGAVILWGIIESGDNIGTGSVKKFNREALFSAASNGFANHSP